MRRCLKKRGLSWGNYGKKPLLSLSTYSKHADYHIAQDVWRTTGCRLVFRKGENK